ncbi:MAG: hypothetical protein ACTS4V_01220 [Candidatus Hodgkinia cicadicola]
MCYFRLERKVEVKPVDVGGATEVEIKRNALCASRSLFWNVKVAVLAKGWGFAVLSGSVMSRDITIV